jgi:hypothetical protein
VQADRVEGEAMSDAEFKLAAAAWRPAYDGDVVVLRDAVRFRKRHIGPYIRMIQG